MPMDIKISQLKAVVPDPENSVIVVKAKALLDDITITELEIAITTDLAPAVAIALLANTARARAARDGFEPALDALAAAVVASGNAEKVRQHLLFDKGGVLPVEMPTASGEALKRDLVKAAGG